METETLTALLEVLGAAGDSAFYLILFHLIGEYIIAPTLIVGLVLFIVRAVRNFMIAEEHGGKLAKAAGYDVEWGVKVLREAKKNK